LAFDCCRGRDCRSVWASRCRSPRRLGLTASEPASADYPHADTDRGADRTIGCFAYSYRVPATRTHDGARLDGTAGSALAVPAGSDAANTCVDTYANRASPASVIVNSRATHSRGDRPQHAFRAVVVSIAVAIPVALAILRSPHRDAHACRINGTITQFTRRGDSSPCRRDGCHSRDGWTTDWAVR